MSEPAERLDGRTWPLAAAWAANTFAYSIMLPFLPLYLHQTRGLPMGQTGLVFLVIGAARTSSQLVAGALSDLIGRRRLLIGGPVARAGAFGVLAALAGVDAPIWAITVALFAAAFLGEFFSNASNAYVTDITPPRLLPAAFSRLRVGLNAGWMSGPAIGAFLARSPFWLLFGLTAVLCLVPAAIAYSYCPETSPPAAKGHGRPRPKVHADPFAPLLRDRGLAKHLLCAFALLLLSSQLATTLSVYATEVVGIRKWMVGMLYTANGAVVILLQIPVNRMLGGLNLAVRISIGALLYAAGYFSLAFAGGLAYLMGSVFVLTVGEMFTEPAIVSGVSRMSNETNVGRYMGVYGLVWGLGYSLGPFIGGVLFGRLSSHPAAFWGILSLSPILAAIGFMRQRKSPAMT